MSRFVLMRIHFKDTGKIKEFIEMVIYTPFLTSYLIRQFRTNKSVQQIANDIQEKHKVQITEIKDQNGNALNMIDVENLLIQDFYELSFNVTGCENC